MWTGIVWYLLNVNKENVIVFDSDLLYLFSGCMAWIIFIKNMNLQNMFSFRDYEVHYKATRC